jgi:hypothetical protein
MTTSPEPPDVVLVPVPRAYLRVVYAALGTAMASDDETSAHVARPGATEEVLVNERSGTWTKEMVRRLQASLEYPGARALLDLCSQRAPEEITLQEIAERTGIEDTQIRAELGAMTKLSRQLYGRKTWPISVRWTRGRANYSMKPQLASWWSNPDD